MKRDKKPVDPAKSELMYPLRKYWVKLSMEERFWVMCNEVEGYGSDLTLSIRYTDHTVTVATYAKDSWESCELDGHIDESQ